MRGNSQPCTLDLARDVMQLHVYLVSSWTAPSGRVSLPPAGSRTTRAAMTSPCASQKTNLAIRGVHHASTCVLSVRNLRRALCEQNTPRRSRRVLHTRSRREPIQSKSDYPAWPLSIAGSATSTADVPGPGFTPAAEHVGVSCVARHGPHARCRANPARSPLNLRPLPGPCLLIVAVSVSFQATHTCVSRRPDCTTLHSHRETRLHAHVCSPTSPLHTATSHMLSS